MGGRFYSVDDDSQNQLVIVALELSPAGGAPEFTVMATNDTEHTPAGHSTMVFRVV